MIFTRSLRDGTKLKQTSFNVIPENFLFAERKKICPEPSQTCRKNSVADFCTLRYAKSKLPEHFMKWMVHIRPLFTCRNTVIVEILTGFRPAFARGFGAVFFPLVAPQPIGVGGERVPSSCEAGEGSGGSKSVTTPG